MEQLKYGETLSLAGLDKNQAAVYETLVKQGTLPASDVAYLAGIGRPLTYKVLDELVALGLVEKIDAPKKVARFAPAHPLKLKDVVESRLSKAAAAKSALEGALDGLVSDFNLQSGKPGVRFFEGRDGIRECLNDALSSKTEICSYVDIAAVEAHIPDISRDFAKQRQSLKLKKKNIGIDTPENRAEIEGYYTDVTEERLVPWPTAEFGTVMQIYDGKVSYFTVTDPMIGIIIADPHIYRMHKSLFEFTWNDPRAHIPNRN